ncbi:MAG TPA: ABC transporter ATP-binding protein [Candidatus Omnitrophica bacterium]|uniref:ABC transporter related protein n=1 Tax=Candidatus Kaiserbacteria bacterium GW2011_GWA2_49_19 TaxID=1618669 RepID=A0A0G1YRG4_9BACT|nr:MAG: ABC transporter related protein [Candidatus Kaiserbacteria bacterium GW2011_GWA2_49_19]OGX21725.1 MAG: ABC transporter ATP-binding protein [Omnitrophica WOR_2 bacterium GWC2_45_7]HBR15251.1 ABC transporter ATP-binding protein [Candidatus Omnitrophota bacterium]
MAEKKIAISIRDLEKTFDGRKVLDNINLDIYQGEIFVIMGGSGSGKSTLLRMMTGGIQPTAGKILFENQDLHELNHAEKEKIKRRFGMSFQSAALLDFLTVEENVSLPLSEHTQLTPKIISIIAKMKLNLVGLQGFERFMPSMLSGGMKKRAGLARAIAMDPEIVFYDEPTAGLDPVVCAIIDNLILDLTKKLNLTSIVVTHNMESIFRIADRVAMLYKGKLLEVGTREEIRNSQDPIVRQFINGSIEGPIKLNEE